jgi:hypothetical protein
MRIKIEVGRHFEIDTGGGRGFYFSIPFIGAGHHGQFGWVFDSWSELKRLQRKQEADREAFLAELSPPWAVDAAGEVQ